MIAILGLLAKLEHEDKMISQRDVYYALKNTFCKQEECNRVIIALGKVLGIELLLSKSLTLYSI